MRKRKLAITIVFFVGVIATVASAFSVYVLDPDSSMQINVDSNDIDVIERKQTFLSLKSISLKSLCIHFLSSSSSVSYLVTKMDFLNCGVKNNCWRTEFM